MTKAPRAAAALITLVLFFSWALPVSAKSIDPATGQPAAFPKALAAGAPPTITVWYEQNLKFGQLGNPQTQINILGNVSTAAGTSVSSLTYQLNGSAAVSIPVGPNATRLINPGDFNVALNTSSLKSGANTLVLTAVDSSGQTQTKTVTVTYTKGKVWPLPYSTNWAAAASIQDQAQVVDGLWQLGPGGVRPTLFGYDRLIGIGDVSWTNYEVLVPFTVRAFYPDPNNPGDAGGVGVIARWQGHIGPGPLPDGWTQLGAYGYYSDRLGELALRFNGNNPLTQSFSFSLNKTYLLKLRAETVSSGGRYSLKVWEKGQPEPDWSSPQFANVVNKVDSTNDLLQGSILLVAHRADATFGDVTICPPNLTYALTLSQTGSGTVTAAQPGKTSYQCGEGVTLSAVPAPGWKFAGWSGDVSGTSSSISFNMTRAMKVSAVFSPGSPVTQGNQLYLPVVIH